MRTNTVSEMRITVIGAPCSANPSISNIVLTSVRLSSKPAADNKIAVIGIINAAFFIRCCSISLIKNDLRISGGLGFFSGRSLLRVALLSKAVAAVYRSVCLGLERHSCLSAAGSTNSCEILPRSACRVLTDIAAALATLRFVLEPTLVVELLLTGRKNELVPAFLAYQSLVFVHIETSLE
jgi:hypothetical protein